MRFEFLLVNTSMTFRITICDGCYQVMCYFTSTVFLVILQTFLVNSYSKMTTVWCITIVSVALLALPTTIFAPVVPLTMQERDDVKFNCGLRDEQQQHNQYVDMVKRSGQVSHIHSLNENV